MPKTYEPIATTTLTSNTATVTFSSIPATYTDLVLVAWVSNITDTQGLYYKYNDDANTNYSRTALYGDGSSAGSNRSTNADRGDDGVYWGTTPGVWIWNIMNYSNTTTYKSTVSRTNSTTNSAGAAASLWRKTEAINKIELLWGTNRSFASGNTFTLYGIKAA